MPPDDWSLRLLGPPELRCGKATLLLEAKRPHQLLAYLAARADWVRREQLAALFWPDRGERAARSNLRKVILLAHHELQALARAGTVDAAPIEDHAGALRWSVATDTSQFLQHARAERHDEALVLYRGPLLQGLDDDRGSAFNEWLGFERSRLAEGWRACVMQAAQQAASPERRAELAARLIARDPLDETAVRLLLAALAASGRYADARHALKDYARQLVLETGLEPSAELQDLCAEAAASATSQRQGAALFVGRAAELRAIEALVQSHMAEPLVIVGPGGIGKSRLLREAVRLFAAQLPQGAIQVDLHGLRDSDALPEHIARALGLPLLAASDTLDALCASLRPRQMLLALDSFDQLGVAAPMIEHLQAQCPRLRIVITSRMRPDIAGAQVLHIDGLTCPAAGDHDIDAFDAVQLFTHHARRARADFVLDNEAAAVAEICRLVDGLPLALELAASWVRLFRPTDIASDLRRSLELLSVADAEPASSVTAILEQSWSLLVPRERQALARLAVFRGSFDREAARVVADASLAVVGALVDKSLLRSDSDARLSLHALVQRFAQQRLLAGDGACTPQQMRQRHAEHYSQVLAGLATAGINPYRNIDRVAIDLENFVAAWQFAVELREADVLERCIETLGQYFVSRGPYGPAMEMFDMGERVLRAAHSAGAPRNAALCALLRRRSRLHYRKGELTSAESDLRSALELTHAGVDALEKRRLLTLGGVLAWARGNLHAARESFDEVLAGSNSDNDPVLADVLGNLGLIAQAEGRMDEARARFAAALAQHRRAESAIGVVQQLLNLGTVCWALRQWSEVVRLMGEALTLARAIDYAEHRPYGLRVMGQAHLQLGDTAAARRCLVSALTLLEEGAEPMQRAVVLAALCLVELAEGHFDAAAATLREAALVASAGALAHDCIGVVRTWAELLLARGQVASAAILCRFVAIHPATLADDRAEALECLERARALLTPDVFAACEQRAQLLELDALLTQAVSLLAPVP